MVEIFFSLQKGKYCHLLHLIWVKRHVYVLSSPNSPFMQLNNRGYAVVPNVIFVISDSLSIFRLFVYFESWVVSWILPVRSREGRERKPKSSKEQKPSWPNLSLMVIIISFKSTMNKVTHPPQIQPLYFSQFYPFFCRGRWTKTTVK